MKKKKSAPKSITTRVGISLYGQYVLSIDQMIQMGLEPGDKVRVIKL